jgi:hypothetical protein
MLLPGFKKPAADHGKRNCGLQRYKRETVLNFFQKTL